MITKAHHTACEGYTIAMTVPPVTIDSTLIQVTIDDNEGIFCI